MTKENKEPEYYWHFEHDPDGTRYARCPDGGGYGDYVIIEIDENGFIKNFAVDLYYFEEDED